MGRKNKSISLDDAPDYQSVAIQLEPVVTEVVQYNLRTEDLPDSTIPYELNLIEMPIFSKNKKLKELVEMKYIFDGGMNEFLLVTPTSSKNVISRKIPQEFDEKIAYGLFRMNQQAQTNGRIIGDYENLLKWSGLTHKGRNLHRAKDSLERLKYTTYVFNKCYFDPVAKQMGADFIKQTKHINIINSLETIKFETFQEMKDGPKKEEYRQCFGRHGNIKEIFIVVLNEDLLKNIETKAFKYFKHEDLLSFDNATARKLFILLTKWRFWKKESVLTRKVKFLASRIPLSWKPSGIPNTVESILHACEELKSTGKIVDYVFHKKRTYADSSIDFCFTQDCLLDRVNAVIGTDTTGTEGKEIIAEQQENIIDIAPLEVTPSDIQTKVEPAVIRATKETPAPAINPFYTEIDVETLIAFVREEFREKPTIRGIIIEALDEHDIEYIRRNILYANKNANGNYRAYLAKALKNDWGLGLQEDEQEAAKVQDAIQATLSKVDAKEKAERDAKQKYWLSLGVEAQAALTKKVQRKFKGKDQKLIMELAMSLAWDAVKKEKNNQ